MRVQLKFREDLRNFETREKPMGELLSFIEVQAMNQGREEGIQAGLQTGRAEGIQTGRAEGLQTGRQEGIQAGRREALRAAVLSALEVRFGEVPQEVRQKIANLIEDEALEAAHRSAITAPDLKSFLEAR